MIIFIALFVLGGVLGWVLWGFLRKDQAMTDRAKFTLEEALAMSNHEFAEAFLNCEIEKVGIRFNESRSVLEAKLDDVARKARLEGK